MVRLFDYHRRTREAILPISRFWWRPRSPKGPGLGDVDWVDVPGLDDRDRLDGPGFGDPARRDNPSQ
jgi:hypothetical protein